jgi:hypothetical protein
MNRFSRNIKTNSIKRPKKKNHRGFNPGSTAIRIRCARTHIDKGANGGKKYFSPAYFSTQFNGRDGKAGFQSSAYRLQSLARLPGISSLTRVERGLAMQREYRSNFSASTILLPLSTRMEPSARDR